MIDYFSLIYFPLLISLFITAVLTPFVIWFSNKYGLVDDPKVHKHPSVIHTTPIPRGGGISLFLGAFLTSLFFIPLTQTTVPLFFASFLALVIGVIDDKLHASSREASPYLRFLINILCAVIVVGSGINIPFITNPLGGILHLDQLIIPLIWFTIPLSDLVAVLWIIWAMNMLNWSKGVDGQMPGIVAISAITIGLLSLRFPIVDATSGIDVKLSFIIAGASLGFLLFNFYPQKIMPGYGATAIYLLLAAVSILSSAKLATAILVMGIPTVDALFTIARRILARKSIFRGDNKHLHHLLLQLGFSKRQVALFYWAISAILGTISLFLHSKSKLFALIMLVVIVTGGLLFLHFFLRQKNEKSTT
jgi:UDP-GlcNAc:undecaprenyl-phosphate/decaprenyl-phosphate GlcNAc-1-phosphate transferase